MIKTIPIQAKTLEELAEKIEQFQNANPNLISKGSIPFSFPNGSVGVIMFFPKGETKINNPQINSDNSKTKKSGDTSQKYKATPEQEERWKNIPPTFKTRNLLIKLGYSQEELKHIKTQFQANQILNSLKQEEI